MSRGKQVQGFDYVTGQPVSMTAAEWRAKYPAPDFHRRTNKSHGGIPPGETHYWAIVARGITRRVAEAYAIIPEGK